MSISGLDITQIMTTIYAGAAKRAITPDLAAKPVFLAGFQNNRRATAVHDDLYVRALSIHVDSGTSDDSEVDTFVLAACDLIGILHADVLSIRQAAQERGIDARGLVVANTHTHSGPDTIGLWGPSRFRSGVDPDYQAFLRGQVVEAVVQAVGNAQPAQLRVGRAELGRWLKNARQPQIVDRELSVLQASALGGDAIFTLVNLACHPEVMFGENTEITADYAGAACRAIEARAGGTGICASADIGGMMTPDVKREDRSFETVEQMGNDVATTALDALARGGSLETSRMHLGRRDVLVPLDNPLFRFARTIGVLPRLQRDRQGHVRTQVSMLDLGQARLVTIPGELFPRSGMRLREMLGAPYRFLIGLADDELGYLLPSDEFVYPRNPLNPGAHYEETMSLSRYATPLLMEAWVALLAEIPRVEEGA